MSCCRSYPLALYEGAKTPLRLLVRLVLRWAGGGKLDLKLRIRAEDGHHLAFRKLLPLRFSSSFSRARRSSFVFLLCFVARPASV
jgi:hypothetical protein